MSIIILATISTTQEDK
ncbi:hypothetical protein [Escherichia coli]|nr:hypothetical protein [Escherichia coli]